MIYLDANATTPLHPRVLAAVVRAWEDGPGNASSVHSLGQRARARLDAAREQCGAALGCDPRELVFTSGGTESDALALRGAVAAGIAAGLAADPLAPAAGKPRPRIVTTAVEHPAVLGACADLERRGVAVAHIAVDGEGRLDLAALAEALAVPGTLLCSAMAANNETGVLFPLEEVGALCQARGVPLHVDAVQAAGKLALNLSRLPASYASVSAHKLRGPQGAGLLWARRAAPLSAVQVGGHQERGKRAGTENVPGAVGLGEALELATAALPEELPRLESLRARLEAAARAIPGARVHGAGAPRLCNTLCVSFSGCEGETLLTALDLAGVAVSTGSACSSGSLTPSPVLLAMGVPEELARAAVRFSLWSGNTAEELERVATLLPQLVAQVRRA